MKNTYRHWMENIKDWCISRQLWWGHRIPAWYFGEGDDDFVVAKNQEEALNVAHERAGITISEVELKQDEAILEAWFSTSWYPISDLLGLVRPHDKEINDIY